MDVPRSVQTYERVQQLLESGGYVEAFTLCQEALKSGEYEPAVYFQMGVLLLKLGRYQDCLIAFGRAKEIDPRDSNCHNNMGIALHRLGKLPEAANQMRQAILMNPNHAGARISLAAVLIDMRQYKHACEECRIAINIAPEKFQSHCNLGDALRALGDTAGALHAYTRAQELAPNSELVRARLEGLKQASA